MSKSLSNFDRLPSEVETLRAASVSETGIDYPALLDFIDPGRWELRSDITEEGDEILFYTRPPADGETTGMIAAVELMEGDMLNVVITEDCEPQEPVTEDDLEASFQPRVAGHIFVSYLAEFWGDPDLSRFALPKLETSASVAA